MDNKIRLKSRSEHMYSATRRDEIIVKEHTLATPTHSLHKCNNLKT